MCWQHFMLLNGRQVEPVACFSSVGCSRAAVWARKRNSECGAGVEERGIDRILTRGLLVLYA